MSFTPEQMSALRTQAARKRLATKAEKEAQTVILEGGAKVYPDSLPGVGWVLLLPVGHKCYMRSKDLCVDLWVTKYKDAEASYPRPPKKAKAA